MNTLKFEDDNLFSDLSPLLTTSEVAKRLKVSKPLVRSLVKQKHLTPVRIGSVVRYSQAELQRFVGKCLAEPAYREELGQRAASVAGNSVGCSHNSCKLKAG